ncbi:cell growth-regulating nucleolar protein-like [Biomphalaria glabrata]|uniref:Cell growth-regulating nucleolar protein-like n=1 Tax=Biomphalaria glabrata TaxID=6526 RepID=A0A9W3B5G1_BIOGL|nr:cell growth-regulating nucleolar protein-like [Biomphalaria glabrata]
MVFFNCNACAEALKKNQVEKHLLRCRQCKVLSCVDCGKDFWGNDYQQHTKCMTENEKYCGKGYVPKVNKGEVKQEQWIEKVQKAIEVSASNTKLKDILEKLKEYPNIPRKKQKFENFLKNSLRFHNQALINQLWDVLMSAAVANTVKNGKNTTCETKTEISQNTETLNPPSHTEAPPENDKSKLSKREKKEERRKLANKKEKKDKAKNEEVDQQEKKTKKRKHSEEEDEVIAEKKSKKKKVESKEVQPEENGENGEVESEQETTQVETKRKKKRFDWEAVIVQVLESKGEISLKKLRKKVLNEFLSQDAANYSEENLKAKFDKKVNKISKVKVFKDRAKLK